MIQAFKNKSTILFLLHLPPPVHGSSMVGSSIKGSIHINGAFKCSYINLLASRHIADTGKISLAKLLSFISVFIKVLLQLIRQKPKLCYFALTATGAAFFKDALLVFLLKLFSVRRVYHLHNKGVSIHQNQLFYRLCYKYVFSDSDVIILSQHLYKDIETFVPFHKIHICPNGIPDTFGADKDLGIDKTDKRFTILFLSNLIETKGVYVLLEACNILKERGLFFYCRFIGGEGDINGREFEEKIKQLGLNEIVSYEGKIYGEEKTRHFKTASVFVFPTFYHNETFGLVNLEAMQNKLPVISTYEGGIPDIIEDCVTGFLIPQRDVGALVEKIELLIRNPELVIKMGIKGREKYEKEFTLDIFENRLIEILGDCL